MPFIPYRNMSITKSTLSHLATSFTRIGLQISPTARVPEKSDHRIQRSKLPARLMMRAIRDPRRADEHTPSVLRRIIPHDKRQLLTLAHTAHRHPARNVVPLQKGKVHALEIKLLAVTPGAQNITLQSSQSIDKGLQHCQHTANGFNT